MKITNGMWLIRDGMQPQYAAEAYDVAAGPEGLTVHARCGGSSTAARCSTSGC